MHLNSQALRTWANASDDAGGHANTGYRRLGLAGLTAGMFGDHRDVPQNLIGIADNVRAAATAFTNRHNSNAKLLRDVAAGTGL